MPAAIPFIPLIAAGVGAAGTVAGSLISRNKNKAPSASASPLSQAIEDPAKQPRNGIMPLSSSPLGDTTNPALSRGRLLGN